MIVFRYIPSVIFLLSMSLLSRFQSDWVYHMLGMTPDPDRLVAQMVCVVFASLVWIFGLGSLSTPVIKAGSKFHPFWLGVLFLGFFFGAWFFGELIRQMRVSGSLESTPEELFANVGLCGLGIIACFIIFNQVKARIVDKQAREETN
ncbi:magnesium-transporting ATPase (P-type) [Pseudomonas frederiksbergensis]|uniref:hypothetical protein n=1 Tax=Pseudomonas TaxID=286 RepID=UPI003D1B7E0F